MHKRAARAHPIGLALITPWSHPCCQRWFGSNLNAGSFMGTVRLSIPDTKWWAFLRAVRAEPHSYWRVRGDDGFVVEGRVTHWPPGPTSGWDASERLFIGVGEIGEPVLVGHLRDIQRLDK